MYTDLQEILNGKMPVLTIQQPFAAMIIEGIKKVEYRNWKLPEKLVGMYILIHSAYSNSKGLPSVFENIHDVEQLYNNQERGAILGAAMFGPSESCEFISLTKYLWPIIDVIKLDEPIRNIKGKQRIWYCNFKELLKNQK